MELSGLKPLILMLVLVGMVIGIGVITFDKMRYVSPNTASVNESITNVVNASKTQALSNGNISGSAILYNSSGEIIPAAQYTFVENTTNGNQLYFYALANNNASMTQTIWAVFNYKNYNTPTLTAMTNTQTEVGNISSNWLGLIVTVAVLAMILTLVIVAFGRQR